MSQAAGAGYRCARGSARFRFREKGSRFLGLLEEATSEEMALERIDQLSTEYAQATHLCWAFRVGSPARERCSDAGEPAGTAGPPMLRVLRGAELSDVVAVVVRWFGGTKLGRGGLVRAYSRAVKEALADLSVGERAPSLRIRARLPYRSVGAVERLLDPPAVRLLRAVYDEEVTFEIEVHEPRLERLEDALADIGCEWQRA